MKLNLQGGSLLWLRRDLRIMDNNLVKHAISKRKKMFFCFVFDNVILEDIKSSPFTEKDDKSLYVDRRVGFIHNTLAEIKKISSKLALIF